jgi:ankyrin repeat protein
MKFITVVAAALILSLGLASAAVAGDPIHTAAYAGDVAKVKALLAAGVKVDARDEYGETPLHKARTAEIARVLLKAGARVSSRAELGYTPLHIAAWGGRADVVEFLLSAGANPKAKNKDGDTPFDLAKRDGSLKGTNAYWLLNEAQYD